MRCYLCLLVYCFFSCRRSHTRCIFFFFQAEDGIRLLTVTGVQTCALPILRADVVPGDRDGQSCSPALSRLVGAHFAERGYSVAFNDPYKGGFITAHHGQPEKNIHAIQIELRRDLYMDENAFTIVDAGLDRVRSTLDALLARLETFTPD